jgi:hypothetical protein
MDAGLEATDPTVLERLKDWRSMFMDAWGNRVETLQKIRQIHEKEPRLTIGGGLSQEILDYAIKGMRHMDLQTTTAPGLATSATKTKSTKTISK